MCTRVCGYFRYGFNPRLPLLGGDATCLINGASHAQSFNPRLPLLGGDACPPLQWPGVQRVSIHASRCWEAMRLQP